MKQKISKPNPPKKKTPTSTGTFFLRYGYQLIIFFAAFIIYANSIGNDYNMDDELVTSTGKAANGFNEIKSRTNKVTSTGWDAVKFNFSAFGDDEVFMSQRGIIKARPDAGAVDFRKVKFSDSSFVSKLKYFLPTVFRVSYYEDAMGYAYEYRPVVLASFAIEHAIFSSKEIVEGHEAEIDSPFISHFINVLLYALLCLLLLKCLQLLFVEHGTLLPFLATLIFALHPAHTEVVDSIKNRDEILALIGAVSALYCALRFADGSKKRMLVLSGVAFTFGLMSKQSVITFAALIPLALVLFRKASVLKLVSTICILLVPTLLMIQLGDLKSKMLFTIALFAFVFFIVFLRGINWDGGQFLVRLQGRIWQAIKSISTPIHKVAEKKESVEFVPDGSSINVAWVLIAAAISLIACAAIFYGIYFNSIYWVASAASLFLLTTFLGNDALKKLLFIPSFLLILIAGLSFSPGVNDFLMYVYFIWGLAYVIFYKGSFRWWAAPVLLGIAVYTMFSLSFITVILPGAVVMFCVLNKRLHVVTRIISGLMIIITINHFVESIGGRFVYDDDIRIILNVLPLIITFRPKALRLVPVIAAATLIFNFWFYAGVLKAPDKFVFYTNISDPSIDNLKARISFLSKPVASTAMGLVNTNQVLNKQPSSTGVDRPINFIEFPVGPRDKQSVRMGTSFYILFHYLYKAIIPYPMSFYYGYRTVAPVSIFRLLPFISMLLYLGLSILAVFTVRRNSLVSYSLFLFLIGVVIFSSYFYPVPGLMADRFLFIPTLGVSILLAVLVIQAFKIDGNTLIQTLLKASRPAAVVLGITLLTYSGMTLARNANWKDDITLFQHDIEFVSQSAQANNLLGTHYAIKAESTKDPVVQRRLRENAAKYFKQSITIYPEFFNATFDLGRTYINLASPDNSLADSALFYLKKALTLNSTYYEVQLNIATILRAQHKLTEAIPYLEQVITGRPYDGFAYSMLSLTYYDMQDYPKSIEVNKNCIHHIPGLVDPYVNIAQTFQRMNQIDSARMYVDQAARMEPQNQQLQNYRRQLYGAPPAK